MFQQVCVDYSSLPDPRMLKNHEIKFFYDAMRPSLKKSTKPRSK